MRKTELETRSRDMVREKMLGFADKSCSRTDVEKHQAKAWVAWATEGSGHRLWSPVNK